MPVRIESVVPGSPAWRAGIRADEKLVLINGEPVLDEIDYQALVTASRLRICVESPSGEERTLVVHKRSWEPAGICLDETIQMKPRQCRNHCIFCFIDQMPPGMRDTLYVKDDDWRLSLMMGNYITLTNVDDVEFTRILRRRVSPLYISVHATDPAVRVSMLRNPRAASLMDRLRLLRDNGLRFHSQIVLCPGINDGEVLDRTISDLESLMPSPVSLAVVPVGLTAHRQGLAELKAFDAVSSAALIDQLAAWQDKFLRLHGTRFVFPSDEFYCMSGRPLPSEEEYEDYPQIENGVGMLRMLQEECAAAYEDLPPCTGAVPRRVLIPTGVSAAPFIRGLADKYAPDGVTVQVLPVTNRFFGDTITVTGLIVGNDLIEAVRGITCDEIQISRSMLRESTDRFLDDVTLSAVEQIAGVPVRVVDNTGEDFILALRGEHRPKE